MAGHSSLTDLKSGRLYAILKEDHPNCCISCVTGTLCRMMREFGPYDITRELGRGAMGVVYLAVHRSLQRECALKTISRKFKDPRAAERFIREGQAVAKLGKHPNIVQVFDAGIVETTPYIAMEYVEGETLDVKSSQQGPLPESELIEIGRKIAIALDHAHRRGIVHRDVKPANVVVDSQGEPQLLDFGIAKDLNSPVMHLPRVSTAPKEKDDDPNSTTEDTHISIPKPAARGLDEGIQGTPAFMAPEQADPSRGPVNAVSDVYALGATLYVLATARRPFEAETITELLYRVITEQPKSPGEFVEISPDLEAVILKSLEKEPESRYQTALEFADDLSRVSMGMPTHARKLGRLGWIWRRLRVYRRLIAIAGVFLLVFAFGYGYFKFRSREIQTLWAVIAQRTARATAQEVESLLDPAIPILEECVSLTEADLLPVDDQELLARNLIARFRYQKKLSWLSYGDSQGRFTGVWRQQSGRVAIHRSWLDEEGHGHVREQYIDGDEERLRWSDDWTYDPRQREFYKLAANSESPVWTKPYEWFGDVGLGITCAFASRDPKTREVQGVFTADYHLGAISDFLANLKIGRHGRAYLLDHQGDLLASPIRGAVTLDELLSTTLEHLKREVPGGIGRLPFDIPYSFSFRFQDKGYVAATEAFQAADGLPVATVVLVPEDDIIGPLRQSTVQNAKLLGGGAILALVVSLIATLLQNRRLLKVLSYRRRQLEHPMTTTSLEKTNILAPAKSETVNDR